MFEIVAYQPEYKKDFERLNMEWIKRYFKVEPKDSQVLRHPEKEILSKGGEIFFAKGMGEILGTCAIIPHGDEHFELEKMAVTDKAKGMGLGEALAQKAIQETKKRGGRVLGLVTNSQLTPAISLYNKLGFKTIDAENSEWERGDVVMRLTL